MARHKDANWMLHEPAATWSEVQVAVLMDIRDELKRANVLLADIAAPLRCSNFLRIPAKLDAIRRNTTKPKRKKKPATDSHR